MADRSETGIAEYRSDFKMLNWNENDSERDWFMRFRDFIRNMSGELKWQSKAAGDLC